MLDRRCFLTGAAALLPAARVSAAPAEVAAPPTVKSFAAPYPTFGSIERLDPALDALVPPGAVLEKLAEGFAWTEGPVWVPRGGYLLFSDIPPNTIYKWKEGKGVTVFMKPAGYHGDRQDLKEQGTNGLALDPRGALVMCQHGNRRLARLASWSDPMGKQIPLAEQYDGKRFNSPNDLVFHKSGDIFFTDPPYGLQGATGAEQGKELAFQGVFRLDGKGQVHLLHDGLERPNGIGLSPDGKTLYVGNSHNPRPVIMAFDVTPERGLANPRVLFDATHLGGGFDGMAVDRKGNLFATGPGGVLVITREGKHLGTIRTGVATANCKFGGDGRTLYITADPYLARIKTATRA